VHAGGRRHGELVVAAPEDAEHRGVLDEDVGGEAADAVAARILDGAGVQPCAASTD
jgi:hypothetical protein